MISLMTRPASYIRFGNMLYFIFNKVHNYAYKYLEVIHQGKQIVGRIPIQLDRVIVNFANRRLRELI